MELKIIYDLVADNSNMSTVDRCVNIYWALRQVLVFGVPGEIAEVGCNTGGTSVLLQLINKEFGAQRELHVFDSFQGLPKPSKHDAYLKEGECMATIEELMARFDRWSAEPPFVHPGWVEETLTDGLPDQIAFAYIDLDFHGPINTALEAIWPRLSDRGIILVDDYGDTRANPNAWEGLPGVKMACDAFFADRPEAMTVLVGKSDLSMICVQKGVAPHTASASQRRGAQQSSPGRLQGAAG